MEKQIAKDHTGTKRKKICEVQVPPHVEKKSRLRLTHTLPCLLAGWLLLLPKAWTTLKNHLLKMAHLRTLLPWKKNSNTCLQIMKNKGLKILDCYWMKGIFLLFEISAQYDVGWTMRRTRWFWFFGRVVGHQGSSMHFVRPIQRTQRSSVVVELHMIYSQLRFFKIIFKIWKKIDFKP